jgi:hypothetical protein
VRPKEFGHFPLLRHACLAGALEDVVLWYPTAERQRATLCSNGFQLVPEVIRYLLSRAQRYGPEAVSLVVRNDTHLEPQTNRESLERKSYVLSRRLLRLSAVVHEHPWASWHVLKLGMEAVLAQILGFDRGCREHDRHMALLGLIAKLCSLRLPIELDDDCVDFLTAQERKSCGEAVKDVRANFALI